MTPIMYTLFILVLTVIPSTLASRSYSAYNHCKYGDSLGMCSTLSSSALRPSPTASGPTSMTSPPPACKTLRTGNILVSANNPSFESGTENWGAINRTSNRGPARGSLQHKSTAPFPPADGDHAFYLHYESGTYTWPVWFHFEPIDHDVGQAYDCTIKIFIKPSDESSTIRWQPRFYSLRTRETHKTGMKPSVTFYERSRHLLGGLEGNPARTSTGGEWVTYGGSFTQGEAGLSPKKYMGFRRGAVQLQIKAYEKGDRLSNASTTIGVDDLQCVRVMLDC